MDRRYNVFGGLSLIFLGVVVGYNADRGVLNSSEAGAKEFYPISLSDTNYSLTRSPSVLDSIYKPELPQRISDFFPTTSENVNISFEDTHFEIPHVGERFSHTKRYTLLSSEERTRIIVWSWDGEGTVREDQLRQTAKAVLERLPMLPDDPNIVELVMETIATETHRGQAVVQRGGGPATGIVQLEPVTIEDILKWLKNNHSDVYDSVQTFWESGKSEEWNRTQNVVWQIAMCYSLYWWRTGSALSDLCQDVYSRACLYRLRYNTLYGTGSVTKYIMDSEKYLTANR